MPHMCCPQLILPGGDPPFKWLLVRGEGHGLGHHDLVIQHLGSLLPTANNVRSYLLVCDNILELAPIQPLSCLESAGGGKGHFKTHASFSRRREKASNGVHVYDTRHFIIIIIIHSALCTCILTTALWTSTTNCRAHWDIQFSLAKVIQLLTFSMENSFPATSATLEMVSVWFWRHISRHLENVREP